LNRNFKEGRTWTYQTYEEICAHFPYLGKEEVREAIERLCKGKARRSKDGAVEFTPVLIKGNFNKTPFDKTTWYAFSNSCYERAIAQIDKDICPNGTSHLPTPIPDTKTDTKESSLKRAIRKSASPPVIPESHYKEKFENKIQISEEQRTRLLDKYGQNEELIEEYVEKLYRWSFDNPSAFKKKTRHDLVVENWIEKDLKTKKDAVKTSDLTEVQQKNWKENLDLVNDLKIQAPKKCGGLHFYYKHYILKDKNNSELDISALIDHKSFCRYLETKLGLKIMAVRFPNEQV